MSISITITVPPSAPTRSDPDNFRERADDYIDWHVNTHVPELNTVIDDFNATIQNLFVGTSSTSNTIGTGSKTWTVVEDNLAYGIGMALRVARTSDPTSYWMEGIVTTYNKSTKTLTIQVQTSHGSGTFTDWTFSHKPQEDYSRVRSWSGMGPVAVAPPFIVSHADVYWVLNTNLADVTAKEPGVDVEWDSLVNTTYEEFTESGTWAKPAGVKWVYVEAIGGGGSGGNSENGGGGGAFNSGLFKASDLGATETVTIGAGADGVATATGLDGGDTQFGSLLVAKGGKGAGGGSRGGFGGGGEPGGGSSSSERRYAGGGYSSGGGGGNTLRCDRGNCVKGGAGGAGSEETSGGVSIDGGNGGDYPSGNGVAPGGGGAGCSTDDISGAGGDGRVRVWAW